MSVIEQAAVALAALFLMALLLRLLASPLRLVLGLLCNAALGLAALWLLRWAGVPLGLNLFNAAAVSVLGLPGLALLVALQWVLT